MISAMTLYWFFEDPTFLVHWFIENTEWSEGKKKNKQTNKNNNNNNNETNWSKIELFRLLKYTHYIKHLNV